MNTIAIINIAKSQLGLDEVAYRAMLVRVTGKESLRTMSETQRVAVVEELKRKGFRIKAGGKKLPISPRKRVGVASGAGQTCQWSRKFLVPRPNSHPPSCP